MDSVFLRSPSGDEIKEVEATPQTLTPYLAQGWNQVPAPESHPVNVAQEEK